MTASRLRRLAGLGLASTVLFTGCSVSGWNPGVAAHVGDDSISLSEVDDTTAAYCSAVETQLEEGAAVPNSVVGTQVAGALTLRAAAEQWAESVGVEAGEDYDVTARSLEQAIADLSEEQREAVRAVNLAQPYLDSVALAYGAQEVGGSAAQAEAARAAGQEAFTAWLDAQDVRIDPRFSVAIEDGRLSRVDTQLSVPVSELAKQTSAGEPDELYVAGLPSSQRCGG